MDAVMRFRTPLLMVSCALGFAVPAAADDNAWPSFRGPNARGVVERARTPEKWDIEKKENVLWRTPIPGLGHSSPVIWGDRLYVTTAVSPRDDEPLVVGLYGDIESIPEDTPQKWKVHCLNKNTGKILWQQTAYEGIPRIKRHPKSSHANSTPATDGRHVVAFFGSEGLYCYNVRGDLLWKKDFGLLESGYYVVPDAQWGFGSSPVIHRGRVYVQCDVQKNSFLAALDVTNGEEIWRTKRGDVPTWSTPTVVDRDDLRQVIVNGYKHMGGYDLATGREVWRMRGTGDIPVPTPLVWQDRVFITQAHGGGAPMYAIRLDAKGRVRLKSGATSGGAVIWSEPWGGAYMQTPLVYDEHLYSCMDNGVLSCYEARTGKRLYRQRLGGGFTGFTASPVAADGKLYFTSETGDVYVVAAGPTYKLLGKNALGENCMSTPAISGDVLYFRSQSHVTAIGRKP